ncbi:hypothetical protein NDU88_001156 [Pleurodeles waltl]|uniref:Uncharacterized protein n=1 Tax=Pleurodeles waltl TaxID=8319 RepID=A0AAV7KXQ8_PLEWA|nr:hypothetical protein NDU88_001156 [Pleurodeles waltl]
MRTGSQRKRTTNPSVLPDFNNPRQGNALYAGSCGARRMWRCTSQRLAVQKWSSIKRLKTLEKNVDVTLEFPEDEMPCEPVKIRAPARDSDELLLPVPLQLICGVGVGLKQRAFRSCWRTQSSFDARARAPFPDRKSFPIGLVRRELRAGHLVQFCGLRAPVGAVIILSEPGSGGFLF